MNKILPIVALVGPPNAGKSTLLNKIAGKRAAITSDIAGTTRDRQYVDTGWNRVNFTLVDTAGLMRETSGELQSNVQKQIDAAVAQADLLILVADGKEPPLATDRSILKKLRRQKKPVLLAVNKLDSPKDSETKLAEFSKLGIKNKFAISAITGQGIGDLLDEVAEIIGQSDVEAGFKPAPTTTDDVIAVSIVGKPNVGKSSLFNKILNDERAVVSAMPGTTRAAVDSNVEIGGVHFTFIDTAGLKKKEYRQTEPDLFGGFQTFKAIRRSDVCFFVIDASQELTKQDQRVAAEIFAMQKGCIILANKCDLLKSSPLPLGERSGVRVQKSADDHYQTFRDYISHHFPFLWMCPLFFVSAITNENLQEAAAAVKPIFDARNKIIGNQVLSEFLTRKLKANPPKLLRDQKKPKVFSLRQADVNPPTFELLVNHPAAISQQFRKFLENAIIKELDFWGTPINLRLKGKDKT